MLTRYNPGNNENVMKDQSIFFLKNVRYPVRSSVDITELSVSACKTSKCLTYDPEASEIHRTIDFSFWPYTFGRGLTFARIDDLLHLTVQPDKLLNRNATEPYIKAKHVLILRKLWQCRMIATWTSFNLNSGFLYFYVSWLIIRQTLFIVAKWHCNVITTEWLRVNGT